jgi:hypothetical protein
LRNDDLWLVSSRQFGNCGCSFPQAEDLDVRRLSSKDGWQESSLAELVGAEPRWTFVYVHGNRVDWYEAHRLGRLAYQSIVSCSGIVPPLRFIIWSWPAEQIRGPLRDVREKAIRADQEGTCFGWFLSQLPPSNPTTLLGYSYGARIVSGGLHLLGGGQLNGLQLPDSPAPSRQLRAIYFAAAFHHGWLCEGSYHDKSIAVVQQLLILYNPCDSVLSRFRFTDRCTSPVALGYVGISPACLAPPATHVEQLNVSSMIGNTHEEDAYWCNYQLMREVCRIAVHP